MTWPKKLIELPWSRLDLTKFLPCEAWLDQIFYPVTWNFFDPVTWLEAWLDHIFWHCDLTCGYSVLKIQIFQLGPFWHFNFQILLRATTTTKTKLFWKHLVLKFQIGGVNVEKVLTVMRKWWNEDLISLMKTGRKTGILVLAFSALKLQTFVKMTFNNAKWNTPGVANRGSH